MGKILQNFDHMTAEEIAALCRYRSLCEAKNLSLQQGQALLASIAQTLTQTISFQQKIDTILRLAGETLAVSRVYIFEDDYVNQVTINTHEWCAEGINPEIDNLQAIPMDFVFDWYRFIGEQGYVNTSNIATLPRNLQLVLEPQNVISIVVFKLQLPNGGTGFAGFDECVAERKWQQHELDILISITGIISSLYEQENLQKQVRAKEQNFINMFNSITDYLFVSDKEGYLLQVNDAVRQRLIYNEIEAAKGRVHILDLHPQSFHQQAEQIIASMADGSGSRCTIPLLGKNNKEVPVETTSWFGEWDDQEVILALSKDFTAEHDALDMFNKLFESNPLPIFVFDHSSFRYTKANQAFVNLVGYEKEELIGKQMEELSIFIDAQQHHNHFQLLGEDDLLESSQLKLQSKEGSILEGVASGSFINSGGLLQFMVVFTDLTQQFALTNQVEKQKQRLEHIVESTGLGTWEWNLISDKLIINRRWAEMFGYTLEELGQTTIRTWNDLIHPEDNKATKKALTLHLQGKNPFYSTECRVRHRDGSYVWVRDTGKVMEYTSDGMPKSMFGSHLDISRAKKTAERLLEAKKRAEEENEAKSRFLAMVSHEIRTPIHTMQGITELLAKSKLTDKQKHYSLLLQQSSHIVLETINNTLDFSKIETDTIDLHPMPFFLNELIDSLQNLFSFRFAQKGLDLITYIHPDTPLHLLGDSFRLMQIIQNLMSNAEKYTANGSVLFSIRFLPSDDFSARIEFVVEDTGMGLDSSVLPELFVPYWQGSDCNYNTTFAGSGLGLPIVKNLVTMMGGAITVESQKDKGSAFKVEIPFTCLSDDTLRTKAEKLGPRKFSKLYLQDTLQTQYLYKALEILDIPVELLEDLGKAREDCGAASSVMVFDWSLCSQEDEQRIVPLVQAHADCRFVVLASVMDSEYSIKSAFHGSHYTIVKKPVSVWNLLVVMQELFQERSLEVDASYKTSARKFGSVLVCEDHAVNREMVQELLMSEGYAVDGVATGRAAIEKLERHEYDLLLLDLQLPGLDGFETAKIIRNDLGNTIPIIAFTAHALLEYEKKSARAGMNGYLKKPIVPAQLFQIVDTWIARSSEQKTPTHTLSRGESDTLDALASHVQKEYGFDLKGALERYLYNIPVYYKHLCHVSEELQEFKDALLFPNVDVLFLKKELHGLGGVIANLGLGELSATLLAYEAELKAGRGGHEEHLVGDLHSYIERQLHGIGAYRDLLHNHQEKVNKEQMSQKEDERQPSSKQELIAPTDLLSLCASLRNALALGDADLSATLSRELSTSAFSEQVQQKGRAILEYIALYEFATAEKLLDSLLAGV